MSIKSDKDTQLLCGRVFTEAELDDVEETVNLFPQLIFNELALTICEGLDWFTANGKYKVASCKSLLRKLEAQGRIILPWFKIKNLASHVLAMATKQIPADWRKQYGCAPVLLETFVDTQYYKGTCYLAAN